MTIVRVNPSGWTDDITTITAAQLNQMDTNTTYAIDGNAGGSYTPSANIDITGPFCIELQGTQQLLLASRSITRHVEIFGATDTAANWTYGPTDVWTNAAAAAGLVYVPLDILPHGQSLSEVHIRVDPAGGHGGDVTPPVFNVHEVDEDLNINTTLGPSTDSTGGLLASGYESAHWFSLTAIGHTIDKSQYRYRLAFAGETGGNWVAGAVYTGIRVVCACTSYPEF